MQVTDTKSLAAALAAGEAAITLAPGEYVGPFALPAECSLEGEGAIIKGGFTAPKKAKLSFTGLTVHTDRGAALQQHGGTVAWQGCTLIAQRYKNGVEQGEVLQVKAGRCTLRGCTIEGGAQCLEVLGKPARVEVVDCDLRHGIPTVFCLGGQTILRDCRLKGGGAALFVRGAHAEADGCVFEGGRTQDTVVYYDDGATGAVRDSRVHRAQYIGVASFDHAHLTLERCTIEDTGRRKGRAPHPLWVQDDADLACVDCTIDATRLGPLDGVLDAARATRLYADALAAGAVELARVALAAGADPARAAADGRPALIAWLDVPWSTLSERWIRERIIPAVDPNVAMADGRTAAFFPMWADLWEALIARGLDIDRVVDGQRPIHVQAAVDCGEFFISPYVLAGGDVEVRDAAGRTPLHCAAKADDWDCVRSLLLVGADLHATDAQGKTPAQRARRGGKTRSLFSEVKTAETKAARFASPPPRWSEALDPPPDAPPCPLSPTLQPLWAALGAHGIGTLGAPVRFWDQARVAAAEHPAGWWCVGDDGLGRLLYVSATATDASAPALLLTPGAFDATPPALRDRLALFDLGDWLAIATAKTPSKIAKGMVGREPARVRLALHCDAVDPLRNHIPADMQVDGKRWDDEVEMAALRRALRWLADGPQGPPLSEAIKKAIIDWRGGERVLAIYLGATTAHTTLDGPFGLLAGGGADPKIRRKSTLRLGGEWTGHEIWYHFDHHACAIIHHDGLAEHGMHAAMDRYRISLGEAIALEVALGRRADDSEEAILLAVADAFGIPPSKAAKRIDTEGALLFLYNQVGGLLSDDAALRRLNRVARSRPGPRP